VRIGYGAAVGARSVILPGVTIGRFAMVGAGAVVTADVPPHGLVVSAPARLIGYVCACGRRLAPARDGLACLHCDARYSNPPAG
jgi:UDP-2-acetamido-3-amino-2,3-dideoxy-glucuronate N-acetyltransferase